MRNQIPHTSYMCGEAMALFAQNGEFGFLDALAIISVIGGVVCFVLLLSLAIWWLAQR